MDYIIAVLFLIMLAIVLRVIYQRVMDPQIHRHPKEAAHDKKEKAKAKIRKE